MLQEISDYVNVRIQGEWMQRTNAFFVRDDKCMCCGKDATPGHLHSTRHFALMKLQASISFMCGEPGVFRKCFMGCLPVNGVVTRLALMRWWGGGLDSMPAACRAILDSTGIEKIALRDDTSVHLVPKGQAFPSELMMVPYTSGQGMYSRHSSAVKALLWCDIPEGNATPATNADEAMLGQLDDDDMVQEVKDLGYWPVVKWAPSSTCVEPHKGLLRTNTYVSCIYQRLEAIPSQEIIAWQLFEESKYAGQP